MIGEKKSGFSKQAEATLVKQAQAGSAESLNELMERHEGLVRLVVQRQWLLTLPEEEARQAGRRGLWRAILGYDPERGTTFSTYAYPAIMRHIWAAVKGEQRRLKREMPVGILAALCYEPGADPAKLRDWEEIEKSLAEIVKQLPERLQGVIAANYGLEDGKPQSLQAIGEELGVSRERVRQLRNAGLVWLSQPGHSQRLRSLLDRHTVAEYEKADRLAQIWLRRRGGRHEYIETVL